MKRHGFTTAELIEVLKGHGLGIKGATLNRYLAEGQVPKAQKTNGQSLNKTVPLLPDEKEEAEKQIVAPPSNVGTMR